MTNDSRDERRHAERASSDITECARCDSSTLFHEPPEYEGGTMTETIRCEECGTTYEQTWRLESRRIL